MNIAATRATGVPATDIDTHRRDRRPWSEAVGTDVAGGVPGADTVVFSCGLNCPGRGGREVTIGAKAPGFCRLGRADARGHLGGFR